MHVDTGGAFQRAVLADCRGSGNHDGSGCVIDWENSDRCLKDCTHSVTAALSCTAFAHGRGCSCAADLAIDGSGGHWAYVTLEDQLNAACTLSPLPEHAGDGTCTSGDIPRDGRCDPQVCIAPFRCTPSTAYM